MAGIIPAAGAVSSNSKFRRRRYTPIADINVTPLVDVVLVLLIIFMVVTPLISQGMPVELPRTVHHDKRADDGKDVMVSVSKTGQVFLRSNPVRLNDVPRLVDEERRRAPARKVYVQGDASSRYGDVQAVMEAVRKGTNLDEVLLRTDEVTRHGDERR
jgi:biopolymer transport protein TolR